MQRLVIATGNPGKLREFIALLAPLGFDAIGQQSLGIVEAEEPYPTFIENAMAKARHACRLSGNAALADDSGLCVDALGGLPGVRSARYALVDETADRATRDRANNEHLIAGLDGAADRNAAFVCCLAFLRSADDPEPVVATGRWRGHIVAEARGEGGFGYDAHFVVPELGLTAAEIDRDTKNRISHRAIAMRRLVEEMLTRGVISTAAA